MWIQHRHLLTKSLHLRRHFSASAAVADLLSEINSPFTYLDELPKPDPKYDQTILAIPRLESGKKIAAKEREAGRIPAVVFEQKDGDKGGNNRLISLQTKQIKNLIDHIGKDFFLSRLFDLEVRTEFGAGEIQEKVRVLPKLLHLHCITDMPLNVTFMRAPPEAWVKVDVPLVYIGDDVSPGLKRGAYLNIIKRTVQYICPADIIPPYIEVDLSNLNVGEKLVAGQLKVHPALKLVKPEDRPICSILGSRTSDAKKSK